jgi:acetyl-CoA hydrolase/succinyl-CoA:acetate CoA-transferase
METQRTKYSGYLSKIITASQAASLFKDKMVIGSSGFTKAGDSKAVLPAFAIRAQHEPIGITLITGASLGHTTDSDLAEAGALYRRMPFQVDPTLRKKINEGSVMFTDQHLSETAELLNNHHLPPMDYAIIEAASIDENGNIIPTTSVGNSATFAKLASKIIIEINTYIPLNFKGIHDIFIPDDYPSRNIIPVTDVTTRIGRDFITIDPQKVVGIVFTELPDSPAQVTAPDEKTTAIADHLVTFFEKEIEAGRLTPSLLPLQAGIGKVANAVLSGLNKGAFKNLTMYSEVLQDSTFELIDSGKMDFASASSITVSKPCYDQLLANFDRYKDKIVLRPQNISNAPEVVRRLGIIAINTAIEFDIYGNVNSTHISGSKMMNGIGGSGDFARNAYLSIFVTQSASKDDNAISHILPMVAHTDHNEHDVDILVTEQGLADLRGLAPRERAKVIIENCAHPDYKETLMSYYIRACQRGGHTPHLLEEAFDMYTSLQKNGSMKPLALAE